MSLYEFDGKGNLKKVTRRVPETSIIIGAS